MSNGNGEVLPAVAQALGPVPAVVEATNLMEVISRAAADPNTDVDKLERLLGLYERIKASDAKRAYARAVREAQKEIPTLAERGKTNQSTYTLWEDANDIIKPILDRHGLNLSFRCGQTAESRILVTGVLSHDEGHSEETTITLPSDTSGNKNAVQAVGSSTSYGKRYTAFALLNITSRNEDDDGKKGGGKPSAETQPQPNRATAATKWANDSLLLIKDFQSAADLSLWQKRFAQTIADVRPLNEAAHKRLVDAIHAKQTEFARQ